MEFLGKLTQGWYSTALFRKQKERFGNIQGLCEIRDTIGRALDTEDNYKTLLTGSPASSKTLFLMSIIESEKNVEYFDASNTTNRILDVLEQKRPHIILLDELDKMSRVFQEKLLGFMESGRVDVVQQKKEYHFEIKGVKVFASCNEPLQSRFRKIFLPRYNETQFIEVSVKVLTHLSDGLARYIGVTVFKNGGDIRDVI